MIIPNIANILWKIKRVWNHQPVLIVTYCNQERMTNIWCVSCQMVHVISLHADTQAFTYAHCLTIMTGYNKKCKYYKKVPVPLDGITISWPRYNHPPSPQRTKHIPYMHMKHIKRALPDAWKWKSTCRNRAVAVLSWTTRSCSIENRFSTRLAWEETRCWSIVT
jgi:hypothetical protein